MCRLLWKFLVRTRIGMSKSQIDFIDINKNL